MKNQILLLLLSACFFNCTPQNSSPDVTSNENLHKVLIDISHGGKDPGAVNQSVKEKDLVFEYSMILKEELIKANIDVLLSRSDDEYVTLAQRIDTANDEKVDLVLSLHFNTSAEPETNGFESYYKSDSEKSLLIDSLIHTKISSYNLVSDNGSNIGNYSILKRSTAPAVLLELGYLSNHAELELLKKYETKNEYAKMLSEAIVEYFKAI
ncbi:N-acetylmuramoyl-L-alanine amidase [candidate division KSB1 bacterium]|nr:N-acetylmuramoyl-L-alanine amidase [candidate division KSB1 bacterium]